MFILILDEDQQYPLVIDRPFPTEAEALDYVSRWVSTSRAWRIIPIPSL